METHYELGLTGRRTTIFADFLYVLYLLQSVVGEAHGSSCGCSMKSLSSRISKFSCGVQVYYVAIQILSTVWHF